MPNLYARATALPNVCGRIDYISNPKRQENLLAFCDSTTELLDGQFWQVLARESQQAFELYGQKSRLIKDSKTGEMVEKKLHCCQGREIHIALSNALLDRLEADEIAQILVDEFQEKLGLQVAAAIHKNKKKNNLHAHVILPERQLLQEPVIKIAERNLFFDADGRRRYKKSEILDENKQLLPGCRIVKKGEIYEQRYFSAVDPEYSYKRWLADVKTNVILPLRNGKLRGDIDITEYDPSTGKLAYQHVGKNILGDRKADIEAFNELVKEFNQMIDSNQISLDEALAVQAEVNHLTEKTATLEARITEFRGRATRQRLAEEEEKKWYSRPDWLRDAHSRYKVYRYDRDGRQRSVIELALILAVVVIDNESKKNTVKPQHIAYAKRDWKVQQMIDSIAVARVENINSTSQLDDQLHKVGADLSRARKEAERLQGAVNNMAPIMQSILAYNALQQKCEKILNMPESLEKKILLASEAGDLERYRQAKANMYQAGVMASEGRQAFLERYSSIEESLQRANQACDELTARYRDLSKLNYNLQMAQIKQYCYDPEWKPETVTQQETQRDVRKQEAQLQHRSEDAPTDPGDR